MKDSGAPPRGTSHGSGETLPRQLAERLKFKLPMFTPRQNRWTQKAREKEAKNTKTNATKAHKHTPPASAESETGQIRREEDERQRTITAEREELLQVPQRTFKQKLPQLLQLSDGGRWRRKPQSQVSTSNESAGANNTGI